jgi:hypothetical protein
MLSFLSITENILKIPNDAIYINNKIYIPMKNNETMIPPNSILYNNMIYIEFQINSNNQIEPKLLTISIILAYLKL